MSRLTLECRPAAEQTAFNLRRWDEVLADPELRKFSGRVETDRHGRILMSPPPAPRHGRLQGKIVGLLLQMGPHGETVPECPVSTSDGIRGVDVAWVSEARWREAGNRSCLLRAPEVCVEVISPSNSEEEIAEKMALYFDAGASEVWICGIFGKMTFFGPTPLERSILFPEFPDQI
jgi:Uma2 family endonuclease